MSSLADTLDRIHAAFPNTPLSAADAFTDGGATYPDAAEYAREIDGKGWMDVDGSYIVRRCDALGFLGTRQLAAVLPVYLRDLVTNGVWSTSAGMVMILLTKPKSKRDGLGPLRFAALVDAFTSEQRAVVAVVLRDFAARDPDGALGEAARIAFESHWNTYLTPTA